MWAGVVASADEIGDQYCENCHVGKIVADEVTISAISEGVRGYALDPDNAAFPSPSFTQVPESPVPYPTLVVASTNDPYCPIDVTTELASKWVAGFVSVGDRGHISTEPGNGDWQEGWNLLEAFASGLHMQI